MSYVENPVQLYLRAQLSLDKKFGPYPDIAARNAIPTEERYPMMIVGVEDTDGGGTNGIFYLHNGITNSDWKLIGTGAGGGVSSAFYSWEWQDGVDVGGTHLDFVIASATADYEIVDIAGCIMVVGGSIQENGVDFTVQTTNFANDTVRVTGTAAEREDTVEVLLFYNRLGETQPQPTTHFPQLQDVPSSYTGHGGKKVKVNSTPDGLEFEEDTLLNQDDTPADYTNQAERTLKVNSAEDAAEFGFALWKGTQGEYDALAQAQKDDVNFIHFILE